MPQRVQLLGCRGMMSGQPSSSGPGQMCKSVCPNKLQEPLREKLSIIGVMGEQGQRAEGQVNLAHRMGLAQPGAQQQVLPLGLMQPGGALSGHLQLFLQHCLGGLQGPRKHPLLLVGKQGGSMVSHNPYVLQHLAGPDSFSRDGLRPCLLFLPLPSICNSLQSLPRYPSQAPNPPSRTSLQTTLISTPSC